MRSGTGLRSRWALVGLFMGLALASRAEAYEFTGAFPGGDCRAMAASGSPGALWYGHFTGRRQSPWNLDFIEGKTVEGCFRTRAECDNWLYQWRSTYQLDFWNDYCAKGWPPQPRPFRPR
ncbi:hypothetical protein MWN34_05590 [Ancylobacter sp. 6x-1]|uniref:Uncharacterized protein n=1 Tax=Ancylobacter crimeensis TaxID=2579147 RepID=A0ABT0D8Z8_9HYPH|nr:hypothetical protein [Ancylobacter crimeensis]MCK0196384.1 hypothetical protein [Ancylobacter crimeensis]